MTTHPMPPADIIALWDHLNAHRGEINTTLIPAAVAEHNGSEVMFQQGWLAALIDVQFRLLQAYPDLINRL